MNKLLVSHVCKKAPVSGGWRSIPFYVRKSVGEDEVFLLNGLSHIVLSKGQLADLFDKKEVVKIRNRIEYIDDYLVWLTPDRYVYYGPIRSANPRNSKKIAYLHFPKKNISNDIETQVEEEHLIFLAEKLIDGLTILTNRKLVKQNKKSNLDYSKKDE